MTAYIRFLQNGMPIHGAVGSGAHAGWSELLGFGMGGRTSTSRPGIGRLQSLDGGRTWRSGPQVREVTITKLTDSSSATLIRQGRNLLDLTRANTYQGGTNIQSTEIAAEVHFVAAGGRATDLRVLIHGVQVDGYYLGTDNSPRTRDINGPTYYVGSANGGVWKTTNGGPSSSPGGVAPIERIVIAYSRMTYAGAPASAPDISQDVRGRLLVGSDQGVWRRAKTVPQGRLYLGSEVGVF